MVLQPITSIFVGAVNPPDGMKSLAVILCGEDARRAILPADRRCPLSGAPESATLNVVAGQRVG